MRRFLVADPQQLRCRECGAVYAAGPIYVCEKCFGPLEAIYDYEALARQPLRRVIESGPPSIWRYEPLLPVNRVPEIDLSPGCGPVCLFRKALNRERSSPQRRIVLPWWKWRGRTTT